ncbi:MAG TPA: hypothetical protein DEB39_05880, partial [Planctomycetaceae bacterium]|nr:hypothetical protein [Planctomycetaceae bacterium]
GAVFLLAGADLGRSADSVGALRFLDNKAQQGGAIYATNNLTIQGNTLFQNNTSVREGGAVYMYGATPGTLTFDLTDGDIAFKGNKAFVGTAEETDQAVFLEKNTQVRIIGHRYLYFEDGISSGPNSSNNTFELNITPNAIGTISNGFVQFSGNSVLNSINADGVGGKDGGYVDIISGQFRIVDTVIGGIAYRSSFSSLGNNAYFDVRPAGKIAGSGNIESQLGFRIGGILAPDTYVYATPPSLGGSGPQFEISDTNPITADYIVGKLTLLGDATFGDASVSDANIGARFQIDVDRTGAPNADGVYNSDRIVVKENRLMPGTSGNIRFGAVRNSVDIATWDTSKNGKYVIATAQNGIFGSDGSAVTNDTIMQYFFPVTVKGAVLQGRQGASLSVDRNLVNDNNEHDIVLNTSNNANLYLLWTGMVGTAQNANWQQSDSATDPLSPPLYNWVSTRSTNLVDLNPAGKESMFFKNGDYIYFNDTARTAVQSVSLKGDWTVGGMEILGGNYSFNGGSITGRKDNAYIGVVSTGKLRIDGSIGNSADPPVPTIVTFQNENDFQNGTELSGGANVIVLNDKAFGVYDGTDERGVVRLTPYLDNNGVAIGNGNATITTGMYGIEASLVNHFEIGRNNTLTLSILEGTFLVDGVDTSGSTKFNGGAFFIDDGAAIARTGTGEAVPRYNLLHIRGNRADYGGAFYVAKNFTLLGNTLIEGNSAVSKGGAIYMIGDSNSRLTLDTANGDIVFRNNYLGAATNANSIYLEQNSTIEVTGGGNTFLDDPIKSGSGGNNNLVMNGTGILQLQGANELNPQGTFGGKVDINSGHFRLAGTNASLLVDGTGNAPVFTLGDGAFLEGSGRITVQGRGGSANMTRFILQGILSPDGDTLTSGINGAVPHLSVDAAANIGRLELVGNVALQSARYDANIGDAV